MTIPPEPTPDVGFIQATQNKTASPDTFENNEEPSKGRLNDKLILYLLVANTVLLLIIFGMLLGK